MNHHTSRFHVRDLSKNDAFLSVVGAVILFAVIAASFIVAIFYFPHPQLR